MLQSLVYTIHNLVARPLMVFPWGWAQRFYDWTTLWGFPPMAACLIYVENDRVLAVARRGTTDRWGLPGGKVESGESSVKTAVRETFEEAKVIPKDLREIYRGRDDEGNLVVTYVASAIYGVPSQGDAGSVGFISWGDLLTGPYKRYNSEVYAAYKDFKL